MSIMEPPVPGEPTLEEPEPEALVPVVQRPTGQVSVDICGACYRRLENFGAGWLHCDASFDVVGSPFYHEAALRVEAKVAWGFQDARGKSEFSVRA